MDILVKVIAFQPIIKFLNLLRNPEFHPRFRQSAPFDYVPNQFSSNHNSISYDCNIDFNIFFHAVSSLQIFWRKILYISYFVHSYTFSRHFILVHLTNPVIPGEVYKL
jgi:hypothetical protein